MSSTRPGRPRGGRKPRRRRGWGLRAFGGGLGVALGAALVAATAIPLAASASRVTLDAAPLEAQTASPDYFDWPSIGTAAVSIPSLGMVTDSPHQHEQPIASLTKMMTAYVTLHELPLQPGESGPCTTVDHFDVTLATEDADSDQSNIKVALGEQLCEDQLLEGLFVHSAGNFAVMLVHLTHHSISAFTKIMNATAHTLGMRHTHYGDVTGFSVTSTSTAADQIKLVDHLMGYLVIREIVKLRSITLPAAGNVGSYTPLLGTDQVVGIKSGFTNAAGLCDAMAVQETRAGISFLTFAVVLGQRGTLTTAGQAARALIASALRQVVAVTYHKGLVVGTLGWRGATTSLMLADTTSLLWWQSTPRLTLYLAPFSARAPASASGAVDPPDAPPLGWLAVPAFSIVDYTTASVVPAGTVVGDIVFAGDHTVFLLVQSATTVARPPWWRGIL